MPRRWLLFLAVLATLAFAAAPALASSSLWARPVDGAAQLAAGGGGATVVWASRDGGATSLLARRYALGGRPLTAGSVVLVPDLSGLTAWLCAGDRDGGLTVAWKADGVTSVQRFSGDGGALYAPVHVCSDAAVAALRGAGASAEPVLLQADGAGGAFLILRARPTASTGDSLLVHVSASGEVAGPDPGAVVRSGTVGAANVDDEGHLFALLGPPGRNGVAVQRFAPDLAADWSAPISPYNPLAGPPPTTAQEPLAMLPDGTAAWREAMNVKLQRFARSGDRLWLRPAGVSAAAGAVVTGDGAAGSYITDVTSQSLRVQHVGPDGTRQGPSAGFSMNVGATTPAVAGATSDRAGDLTVAWTGAPRGSAGVAQVTCLGTWTSPALDPAAAQLGAAASDDAGGAYVMGAGSGAQLWRLAELGDTVTLRPRSTDVQYGDSIRVGGYVTVGGEPLAGSAVQVRLGGKTAGSAITGADGYYETAVKPESSAPLTAVAEGPGGGQIVSAPFGGLVVSPAISLTLSNRSAGLGYVETFSGDVKPAHPGSRVYVQRKVGSSWRLLASGRLNGASKYAVSWPLPLRTATYLIRTVLPAHGDHAQGVSRTARLRVVVRPAG